MLTYNELSERIPSINEEVRMRKITHEILDELFENAKEVHHMGAQVNIMVDKGYLHYYKGDMKNASDLIYNALSLANQIDDAEALIAAHAALGSIYGAMGLYEHALQNLIKALEISKENNVEEYFGKLYSNIGTCLYKQELFEDAGKYTKLAYDYYKESENVYYRFFITLNIVVYFMQVGKYEEAEKYLKSIDDYIEEIPPVLQIGLKTNYARLYAYQDKYKQSIDLMNEIFSGPYLKKIEVNVYDQIIEWCVILQKKNKLMLAKDIVEKSVENIIDIESTTTADLLMLLADIYQNEGKFQKASELYQKAVNMRSDLYTKNQQLITYNTLKLLEITKKNKELAKASFRDALTGCFNRQALVSEGQKIIDKTIEASKDIAVIMFDIDYFKQFNDYYGHIQGDNCIKSIADAIQKSSPEEERYFYRYGGDEFLILWPISNCSGKEIAGKMLKAIRNMKLPHKKSPKYDIATISIGVNTVINKSQASLQNSIDAADINLYKAKFNNRNCAFVDNELVIE